MSSASTTTTHQLHENPRAPNLSKGNPPRKRRPKVNAHNQPVPRRTSALALLPHRPVDGLGPGLGAGAGPGDGGVAREVVPALLVAPAGAGRRGADGEGGAHRVCGFGL